MFLKRTQSALTLLRSWALFSVTWQLNGPVRLPCCVAVRIAEPQQGVQDFSVAGLGPPISSRSNFPGVCALSCKQLQA